jgi:hypothetical protein
VPGHSPFLVQNTAVDGGSRVRTVLCRGSAAMYSCQRTDLYDFGSILTR